MKGDGRGTKVKGREALKIEVGMVRRSEDVRRGSSEARKVRE